MRLFDDGIRTDQRYARKSEPTYSYYNRSARPSVLALREVLEAWFDRIPNDGKPHLKARFQSPLESSHQGAFFELYLHELFTRIGLDLRIEPPGVKGTARPDFLASCDGIPLFYVEATVTGLGSQKEQAAAARMAVVYDLINTIESPNFFLKLDLRGAPETPPPTRDLRRNLETWLASLDPDFVGQLYMGNRYEEIPELLWSHEGWEICFAPIPKSPQFRGRPNTRPIGVEAPEGGWVTTHICIREAVGRKARKYGDLQLPLIVAINVLGVFCHDSEIMSGLYGEDCVFAQRRADGTFSERLTRTPNGAWGTPTSPRNTLVSGALIAPGLNPWSMGVVTPELFPHPWCKYPLQGQAWPLPQCKLDWEARQVRREPGSGVGKILDIPSPWPIHDE